MGPGYYDAQTPINKLKGISWKNSSEKKTNFELNISTNTYIGPGIPFSKYLVQ